MRKSRILLLMLLAFFSVAEAKDTIRIACIGNSITEGYGIKNPKENSYPAVLQHLLGDGYKVFNFGLSGRTMLNKGDRPYMKEDRYQEALVSNPDIVIIKLGTNDTKPHNWKYGNEYQKDMEAMIATFRNLPSRPQIYLCIPVPVVKTHWGINDSTMANGVIPYIKEVAAKEKLEIIDLRTPLLAYPDYFPDKIHPNKEGAEIIAKEVYKALVEKE